MRCDSTAVTRPGPAYGTDCISDYALFELLSFSIPSKSGCEISWLLPNELISICVCRAIEVEGGSHYALSQITIGNAQVENQSC